MSVNYKSWVQREDIEVGNLLAGAKIYMDRVDGADEDNDPDLAAYLWKRAFENIERAMRREELLERIRGYSCG